MLSLSALGLSSCQSIEIKDAEFCGDAGSEGAFCFNTLSDARREVTKADWDSERFGMICTKAENFADWKAAILKLCSGSKFCTYRVSQEIVKFSTKVESLSARFGARHKP